MLHDLSAAVARALHQAINRLLVHQFGNRNARDRRISRQGNHGIAVSAQHKRGHVFHRNIQFARDKGAEARRVQNAGHADHAIAREATLLVRRLRHRIQRIRNDDQNAVRRILNRLADHVAHDLVIGVEQVVATHPRLARDAGRNHHNVRVCRIGVIVCAEDVGVAFLNRHRLQQIETFALWDALNDVDENYVGVLFRRQPVGCRRPHVS